MSHNFIRRGFFLLIKSDLMCYLKCNFKLIRFLNLETFNGGSIRTAGPWRPYTSCRKVRILSPRQGASIQVAKIRKNKPMIDCSSLEQLLLSIGPAAR